jgi:hypothetical protein
MAHAPRWKRAAAGRILGEAEAGAGGNAMSPDFEELLERATNYQFDPLKLDAVPISGTLRKAPSAKTCLLVLSSQPGGDMLVEIELADVVKHEVNKAEDTVTLHVKPTAVLTASVRGRLANALVPAFAVASAFAQGVREPVPGPAWREIVRPFSRLDVMLNLLDGLAWTECRVEGKRACEALFPRPDQQEARNACIAEAYIACGERPTLRVDERVLEQLVDLFRGPVRR